MLDHLLKHIDNQGAEGKRVMSRLRGVAFDRCACCVQYNLYPFRSCAVVPRASRSIKARVQPLLACYHANNTHASGSGVLASAS